MWRYLYPEKMAGVEASSDRVVRDLNALLKISTIVNSIRDPDALQEELLNWVVRVVPADRTAILLCDPSREKFESVKIRTANGERAEDFRISRTITQQVLREGIAVLDRDVKGNHPTESLVASHMSPLIQTKLLRVLQTREFDRLGGTRPISVDIRLIAATNQDLKKAVSKGSFREDLFYRLNVVPITIPSLRERREDIPLLANYFAAMYCEKLKRKVIGISREAHAYLAQHDWPGNVRELENAMERAIVLGTSEWILPEDLPDTILEQAPASGIDVTKYHDAVTEAKKAIIRKAVKEARGNFVQAAKILGINSNYLHRLVSNLNLRDEFRDS